MRLIFCIFLAVMFSVPAQASQTMAKFIFEDAEKAFAAQDFNTAIRKLNEAEKALGKTNMPILNLRINARYELLKQGAFYLAMHDALKADMDNFLENYGSNLRYENEARQVYRLSQELKSMREKDAALLASQEKMAESGDIRSIDAMINRYSSGAGVNKNDKKATYWRSALLAAQVKAEHEAAQAGNMDAMRSLSRRYAEGDGVEKNQERAMAWAEKLKGAEAEASRLAHEREVRMANEARDAALQRKIDEINFFPMTSAFPPVEDPVQATTAAPTLLVPIVIDSVSSAPVSSTRKSMLRRQMTSRPTAWAKPDSMVGKAYAIYQANP